MSVSDMIILTTKVRIRPGKQDVFADWQTKLNASIAAFPGFVSLEILSPSEQIPLEWVIVQRFSSSERAAAWRNSKEYQGLIEDVKELLDNGPLALQEMESGAGSLKGGVTEVFVTQVSPEKDQAFRQWIAKMHQVEAKFPGFRGVYVQSPVGGQGKNWITLLQFDTVENLDRWLGSREREQCLSESKSLIASLENHRVISSYEGWFSSLAKTGEIPPVWKQTMLVLLVLFPIVMLELKFLDPLIAKLGSSLATFVANAISVLLISWPLMPIAIAFLGWWLSPGSNRRTKTILGACVVLALYFIEVAAFWNLL